MWSEMQAMENGRSRYNGGGGDRGHSSASEQHPPPPQQPPPFPSTSEDLHAWSIYRQNLNSDFTDSALGSSEKSPMPYGNFHLRETTMQSILNNPKYGPKSELGTNMYTYLKFGLPRVLPPNGGKEGDRLSASRAHDLHEAGTRSHHGGERGHLHHHHGQNSSGYDSTDEELMQRHGARSAPFHGGGAGGALRAARSEDFLSASVSNHHGGHRRSQRALNEAGGHHSIQKDSRRSAAAAAASRDAEFAVWQQQRDRERKLKSVSEANLLEHHGQFLDDHDLDGGRVGNGRMYRSSKVFRSNGHLQHAASSHDLLQTGAFVNRAMEDDEDLDDGEDMDEEDHGRRSQAAGRMAKAASQISVVSRHSRNLQLNGGVSYRHEAPMLNDKYFPRDYLGSSNYLGNGLGNGMANGTGGGGGGNHEYDGFKYPHLQLRNVSFDTKAGKKSERILDSITMEARGGELVAILATKQGEGTALCDIISNSYNSWQMKLHGDILINGVSVSPARLQDRVAYVRQDNNFSADMSVRQTMLFHAFLREPGTHARSRDTKGRINALIEDLGLAQVKHTRVKDLTVSERQRLNVACHLLLDTDIVILDQPTRGMDIFDTFFLVEYLRQWAARGRIVLITLHPPTYEILTMISKVVLISTGRVMYYGKRREMLPYFAFIEYPCPAYKNPSDYYLDLVTLDDLSNEAMLESSQRIDQLGNAFKRRAEPLSDPGPPGILPPKIKRANVIVQILGLWIRALIYMYPFNVISWVKMVLLSGVMSICLGGIFLGIRWRYWDRAWQNDPIFEQDNIGDRLGFHYVFMIVGVWPMMLAMITEEWRNKRSVTRDIEDRLYSKAAYILTKTVYSIPSAGGIFLAYIIPGYLLAGIHYPEVRDLNIFYLYIAYMFLYLFTLRITALSLTHLFNSRHLSAGLTGLLFTTLAWVSGFAVHEQQLGVWVSWLKYVSPQYWMSHPITQGEFGPVNVLRCTGNPVITENSIIKQVPCGLPSGEEVIRYFGFMSKFKDSDFAAFAPLLITAAFYVFFQALAFIFFIGKRQVAKMSRSRKNKM